MAQGGPGVEVTANFPAPKGVGYRTDPHQGWGKVARIPDPTHPRLSLTGFVQVTTAQLP